MKNYRVINRIFSALLAVIVLLCSAFVPIASASNKDADTLEIWYLDIGQGDAAVVTCGEHAMMIDGGPSDKSDLVYSFLKKHKIETIDYMVATHSDADHVGGLSGALNAAKVKTAFCTVTESNSNAFANFKKFLEKQNSEIVIPNSQDVFPLGKAKVEILAPEKGDLETRNTSIALKITFGEISFLFPGDDELEDEKHLIDIRHDLESTVLKVAHHGSSTSTTEDFLDAVDPEYAVISVGGDNDYGHPTEQTLTRLKDRSVKIYRTDMQGTIHCKSDGKTLSFDVEKNADMDTTSAPGGYQNMLLAAALAEAEACSKTNTAANQENETLQTSTQGTDYIGNKNSYKFHYPWCGSVDKMKESNKYYFNGTREEMIAMGYVPCKICNP